MNRKGEITIYLSLSMAILISLLLAIIQSDIDKAMRMRTENAMDMAIQSVFAEYNKELLKNYDLYFIDSSYGTKSGDAYYTGEHIKNYLSYNLNPSKGQVTLFEKDLFGMSAGDVKVLLYSLATDNNGNVYKRQAIQAVKDRFGASIVEGLRGAKDEYYGSGIEGYNLAEKRENTRKEMISRAAKARNEEGKKIPFKDPTKDIETQRMGILNSILDKSEISFENIDNSSLSSRREIKTGDGIVECSENLNSIVNNLLFIEYLGWKFGCYTNQISNTGNKYEIEYILKNKSSDAENLKSVVNQLLLVRETANTIFLFSNAAKRAEAEAVASVIAAMLLMPEITEIITDAILFSWAFAESCIDIRTLLDGGKVPIMKTDSTWVLSFSQALVFKAHLKDGMAKSNGLDYLTYLKIFLIMQNSDNQIWRSLDMIEKNLRGTSNNSEFKIDNCIEYLDAEAVVNGKYGFNVSIRRYFGYYAMPSISY